MKKVGDTFVEGCPLLRRQDDNGSVKEMVGEGNNNEE